VPVHQVTSTWRRPWQVSELSWLPGWSMSSWSASGGLGTAPALVPWHGMACTPCPPTRARARNAKEIDEKRTQEIRMRACVPRAGELLDH
jgi:hypothetical protein